MDFDEIDDDDELDWMLHDDLTNFPYVTNEYQDQKEAQRRRSMHPM